MRGRDSSADERGFERAVKGAACQFAYRVGAGTNRCNPQVHCFSGYHRAERSDVRFHRMLDCKPEHLQGEL